MAETEILIEPFRLRGTINWPVRANALAVFAQDSGSSRLSPRDMEVVQQFAGRGAATFLFDLLTRAADFSTPARNRFKGGNVIFTDRRYAGRRLAHELIRYKGDNPVVLALPRGGVVVAAEVAAALDAPLDLVLVRKIGVPIQPELAMGAVVDGARPHIIRNEDIIDDARISETEFNRVCEAELLEIERRRSRYLADRPRAAVTDRMVIVVDDGIATGATVRAALEAILERGPKWLLLAIPVAPPAVLDELADVTDEIVCLQTDERFYAIGLYYEDFRQVSDAEVIELLNKARAPGESASRA